MSRDRLLEALSGVARGGVVSFAQFMDVVLYDPVAGYYARPGMRVGRDFQTSPTLSDAFGRCLGRQAYQFWDKLDRPRDFTLLEVGAGGGELARDILTELRRKGLRRIRYRIVERSPSLRETQQSVLTGFPVEWSDELGAIAPFVGAVLSNELFDALPVHRLVGTAEGVKETGVAVPELEERLIPADPEALSALETVGVTLAEGQRADTSPAIRPMMHAMAGVLRRGYVLAIDYGEVAERLYRRHPKGTLRAYYRQLLSDTPYLRLGEQDLTADVDFTMLQRAGEEAGLQTLGLTTQGEFLLRLGIRDVEREAGKRPGLEGDFAVNAVRKLYRPEVMGERFKVLVQATPGAPGAIAGLGGDPVPRRFKLW